jgi:hypothetical protein
MISITGSIHRSFVFPADRPTAFDYYSDWRRTLGYLTHISFHPQSNNQHYRMLYSTTELGIYQVKVYCYVVTNLDRDSWTIYIQPLEEMTAPVRNAGLYSMKSNGFYSSQSIFHELGEQTKIEYRLNLSADLPAPYALRFMPKPILQNIAQNIAQRRIEEIVEKFIQQSIAAFLRQSKP